MKNNSKDIEEEINNFRYLVLYLDKYLINIKEKESQLKLSENSKEVIKEIIQSPKITNFFCQDENIKNNRNSIGLIKAINEMLFKKKFNNKKRQIIRKVDPYSFNQSTLLSNNFYYSSDIELYLIKNIIKNKIYKIIKSCFDYKFNENKEEILNKNYENNNHFILISNNLKMSKIRNEYSNSLINKNSNILTMKDYFSKPGFSKSIFFINKNNYENKLISNNSCKNFESLSINKDSSLINEKTGTINNHNYDRIKRNKSIYNKKSTLYESKLNNKENSFLPELNNYKFKKKNHINFIPKKIPSFGSDIMELIYFNTKNNVKMKKNENFLNDCIRETYINLRKINQLDNSKCFVDYSKNSIIKDSHDMTIKRSNESIPKEKKKLYGFEYKHILLYSFNGKLPRKKSNTINKDITFKSKKY